MRVDFFVVGVQKGGTTALDAMLRGHPEVGMARQKELHFFDDERIDWSAPDYTRLHAAFDWADATVRIRGEVTPIYLYWPPALPRLKRYNPRARLVVALRHPLHRAYSGWRMLATRGEEPLGFAEAVSASGRARVARAPGGVKRKHSYVERSLYAEQIVRLLGLFPRAQVHFLRTDRLWQEPGATLAALEDFLGVRRVLAARAAPAYVVPLRSRNFGAIPPAAAAMLADLFRADILRTAALTGLDLADWLDPGYREPMRPPEG